MAKKVVIPVSFLFDDISNLIQKAKNSLKAINIESNIGLQYSKAFAQIEKEIESILKKAAQGIASLSDINSFARSFLTITGYIERILTLSRKINFNDINLTSELVNQYKSLVLQLEKAKLNLSQFKRELIKNLFDNDLNFSLVLQDLLKISKESFTSQKQISDALNSQLKTLKSQTAERLTQIEKDKELLSNMQSVEGLFSKYGITDSKGGMKFKSGQATSGRQEILSAFSQFGIDTDKLANASLNDLIRAWNVATNQLQSEIPKAILTTELELTNLDTKLKLVVQAQEALNNAMSSGQYDKVSEEVKNASQNVENYKTTVVQSARETADGVGASSDKIIDSLTLQETELLKLQSQYSASIGAADLFSRMESGIKRLVGVSAVLIQVRKGIQEAVSQIKELDSAMNGIAVVTDFTTKLLWNQIDSYMAVAKLYGVTTTGVYQVSQLYYQQGQDVSNVNKLTAETLKMARIAGLDYATTTDYMTTA